MMLKKFHYSRLLVEIMLIFGISKVVTDKVFVKEVALVKNQKQLH